MAYQVQERAYVAKLQQEPENDYYATGLSKYDLRQESDDAADEDEDVLESYAYNFDEGEQRISTPGEEDSIGFGASLPDDLAVPQNRLRIEWLTMLASVLTGDVVRSEKKRISGNVGTTDEGKLMAEIWIGLRAKVARRSAADERRIIEDARQSMDSTLETIAKFQVRDKDATPLTPHEQVVDILGKLEWCESMYSSRSEMLAAKPIVGSDVFLRSSSALTSWLTVTESVHTSLNILRKWTGNHELDVTQPASKSDGTSTPMNEESFIERVLKENGLEKTFDKRTLISLDQMIDRAKQTMIANADAFAAMHLPPYLDELILLINFPTRLIEEALRIRLDSARKLEDPTMLIVDQMLEDFVKLLKVAIEIKKQYIKTTEPEAGWQLPACIGEDFDSVVLEAIDFYFRLLHWKLGSDAQNHFKEAEILEHEYEFLDHVCQYVEGGEVQVAEQFTALTYKLMHRILQSFDAGLVGPKTKTAAEMQKHYTQLLENTRLRHRKLLRFSKTLSTRFENSTDYAVEDSKAWNEIVAVLADTSHVFAYTASLEQDGLYVIVDQALAQEPAVIKDLLRARARDAVEADEADPYGRYVLIMCPPETLSWPGQVTEVSVPETNFDVRPGRIRLVSDGSPRHLQNANAVFSQLCAGLATVAIPRRANLSQVNREMRKIQKVSYRISNAIMDSVARIRETTKKYGTQELVQTTFAFATEFGQRAMRFMTPRLRGTHNAKLVNLAIDWVVFICDDCDPADRKTFRWTVAALEFAMLMSRGRNILLISEAAFTTLRVKVARCMTLLISHFDVMGARSAAQMARERTVNGQGRHAQLNEEGRQRDETRLQDFRDALITQLDSIEERRKQHQENLQLAGRVLDDTNSENRSLMHLASSLSNITMRWTQGRFIGSGTFGTVYQGVNLDTGELIAVKEIRLQDPHTIPQTVAAIKDEMTVLEMLNHPNIVTYYGVEVHRDKVYIFMELCQGGSLGSQLEHGRIAEETVLQVYTLQMLEGLAHLHERGIAHRDIKPENVLLDHNGVIKFTDFGSAKVLARRGQTRAAAAATRASDPQGTPMYMAPETITGKRGGRRGAMDIWALGCCVVEMATAQRPWASLDNQYAIMFHIASGGTPTLPSHDQLSPLGIDFLEKCFDDDPTTRASAMELLNHPWMVDIRQSAGVGVPAQSDSASIANSTLSPNSASTTTGSSIFASRGYAPWASTGSSSTDAGGEASQLQMTTDSPRSGSVVKQNDNNEDDEESGADDTIKATPSRAAV